MKLHLGCGNNILEGYTNVDKFVENPDAMQWDALELPLGNESVEEIYHQHMIEHLDFHEEKKAFDEWWRVLKPGGKLVFEVLDFEWLVEAFLNAEDNWKEFYKKQDDHYFGYGINNNQRWSVLIAHFYGNASHEGQYHKNAYTAQKIEAILDYYGYSERVVVKYVYERFDLPCLRAIAVK